MQRFGFKVHLPLQTLNKNFEIWKGNVCLQANGYAARYFV